MAETLYEPTLHKPTDSEALKIAIQAVKEALPKAKYMPLKNPVVYAAGETYNKSGELVYAIFAGTEQSSLDDVGCPPFYVKSGTRVVEKPTGSIHPAMLFEIISNTSRPYDSDECAFYPDRFVILP
jgi:hypothetical protein